MGNQVTSQEDTSQEDTSQEVPSFEERFEEAKTEVSNRVAEGYVEAICSTFQESKVETLDDLGNVLAESLGKIVNNVIVPSLNDAKRKFEPELKRIEELLQSIPALKVENFDPQTLPVTVLDKNHDDCAICLEQMKVGDTVIETQCKHVFHKDCILLWFNRSHLCPLCRGPQKPLPQETVQDH